MNDRSTETLYFEDQFGEAHKETLLIQALSLQQTKTSQTTNKDLQPEFTNEERFIALHTIIQQMIDLYGYQATRAAFFVTLFNHIWSLDAMHSSSKTHKLNGAMVEIQDFTPSFINFLL